MKSRKGGYKLVSLQLVELTTMTALAGLHDAIVKSHDKPLLISDIMINGERKNNLFCMVEKDGDEFIIKDVYGKDIKVNAQDEIEVTESGDEDVTIEVTNIKALTKKQCEQLKCGDRVIKKTGNQRHLYVVTYKEHHVGICLSYVDASVVETQSYDYTDGNWVYNSEDKTPLINVENAQSGTIVDALGLDAQGNLVKGQVSGGAKLYRHSITFSDGTVSYSIELIMTHPTPATSYAGGPPVFDLPFNKYVTINSKGVAKVTDYMGNCQLSNILVYEDSAWSYISLAQLEFVSDIVTEL